MNDKPKLPELSALELESYKPVPEAARIKCVSESDVPTALQAHHRKTFATP
jgi:hypothetical protein